MLMFKVYSEGYLSRSYEDGSRGTEKIVIGNPSALESDTV